MTYNEAVSAGKHNEFIETGLDIMDNYCYLCYERYYTIPDGLSYSERGVAVYVGRYGWSIYARKPDGHYIVFSGYEFTQGTVWEV